MLERTEIWKLLSWLRQAEAEIKLLKFHLLVLSSSLPPSLPLIESPAEDDARKYTHVSVDIENYREKRESTLKELAEKMADKVKKTGKNYDTAFAEYSGDKLPLTAEAGKTYHITVDVE